MTESHANDAEALSSFCSLPSELRTSCLSRLEAKTLIPLMTVSSNFHALIDGILRQRFFDLITSREPECETMIQFECSAPSDPTRMLQHVLYFDMFSSTAYEPTLASFTFCTESSSVVFGMDATQSFETFLLAVKVTYTGRGAPNDLVIAEGLERVWRTWFAVFDEHQALDSGFSELALGQGQVEKPAQIEAPNSSMRSLVIDQTIAKASLVLMKPPPESKGTSVIGRELYHRQSDYEFAWKEVSLNIGRVVVAVEEAEKRNKP